MTITITEQKNQKTSNWAGGTTTELAIFPPGSDYASRHFLFRISTAYCALASSHFTVLPDTERLLMPLEGSVELRHNGGPAIALAPGDVDRFLGQDDTTSTGVCRDFNLMLKGGVQGDISSHVIPSGQTELIFSDRSFAGIYVVRGEGVLFGEKEYALSTGSFCLIERAEEDGSVKAEVKASEQSELVLAEAFVTVTEE